MRAHPGQRVPVVRRTGQEPARRAVPGGLAPRPRTGHRARRPHRRPDVVDRKTRRRPGDARPRRLDAATTRATWTSCSPNWTRRSTTPGCAATCCPPGPSAATARPGGGRTPRRCPQRTVDPRTVGKTYTAPDGKTFRPVAVPHPHLPVLRPGDQRRDTRRSGQLRLRAGGAGRAALRRAVRPVHPEPAPPGRLRRAVLRRDRTATAARPARPPRHARHRLPRRTPRSHRRDLPPGVVAIHRRGPLRRRPPARLGRRHRRPTSTPRPAKSAAHLGRGARRHRRR